MDEIKRAMLEDQEAERRLTETGYFKASGDLALCRCPFCGSEEVVYERYLHTVGYRWRVVCTSCMASIDPGYAQQRSMVQRMWNTRAPILSESGAYLFGLDGQSLDLALSALRSITREQMEKAWKGEWVDCSNGWMCSRCEYDNTYAKPFCPNCGAPMTDEAADMVMERLEALRDE